MKPKTIKIGYTIPGDNYNNFRIDYEAELESWEDEQESIKFLRRKCLQAAKDAGFNVNAYVSEEERLQLLEAKNQETQERLNFVRAEFEKLSKECGFYHTDLDDVRTIAESIQILNQYQVENKSRQLKTALLRLADRHPNLFQKSEETPEIKEESDFDPIPFSSNDAEDSEEEEDEDRYF